MPAKKKRLTSQTGRYRFQYAAKFICTANIPGTSQNNRIVSAGQLPDSREHPQSE